MKKLFVLLAAMAFTATTFAVEVGKPAPDFTGTDINGKTVKLSDYKGKIVVIESYNSDCPFCGNQYKSGAMQELQKDLAAKGVVWLMVDSVNTKNFSYRTPEQARKESVDLKIAATAWIDDSFGPDQALRLRRPLRGLNLSFYCKSALLGSADLFLAVFIPNCRMTNGKDGVF